MFAQIFYGSVLLIITALLHVAIIVGGIPILAKLGRRMQKWGNARRVGILLSAGIALLLFAHAVEIWMWAAAFAYQGQFDTFSTSFYFAIVTYTTLGYGDIVLSEDARIFAGFCAIAGLLAFGISTALLIGLLTRIMPKKFGDQERY